MSIKVKEIVPLDPAQAGFAVRDVSCLYRSPTGGPTSMPYSKNVSSMVDIAVGRFKMTFSIVKVSNQYAAVGTASQSETVMRDYTEKVAFWMSTCTTTVLDIDTVTNDANNSLRDTANLNIGIIGG